MLTKSGVLSAGEVSSFEAKTGGGNWSKNAQLVLDYSENARGERPKKLFLKMVNTDLGDGDYFLPSEVTYYTRDYVSLPNAPLVRCFAAADDHQQQRYYLLLEDLSDTHKPAYDVRPTLEYGLTIAEGLAMMHAHWWGEDRLGTINTQFHDADHLKEFVAVGEEGIEHVNAVFADRLKSNWPALIDEIFEKLPAVLSQRGRETRNFTLIHGDPNPSNILVPHTGVSPLYFIDQQPVDFSVTVWSGLYDLAYVMALYWPTILRRELETPVLRHYHNKLIERGVDGYSWDDLWHDYRLATAIMVPMAVEYMCDGGHPDWNEFRFGLVQRTLTAFEDLNGYDLF